MGVSALRLHGLCRILALLRSGNAARITSLCRAWNRFLPAACLIVRRLVMTGVMFMDVIFVTVSVCGAFGVDMLIRIGKGFDP